MNIHQMALIPVASSDGVSITVDGTEETTETIDNEDTIEVLDYITNHESETITGPNDTLSGEGYYSDISNNITDRGFVSISSPDGNHPSGYYSSANNNITDRGSIDDLEPGDRVGVGIISRLLNWNNGYANATAVSASSTVWYPLSV